MQQKGLGEMQVSCGVLWELSEMMRRALGIWAFFTFENVSAFGWHRRSRQPCSWGCDIRVCGHLCYRAFRMEKKQGEWPHGRPLQKVGKLPLLIEACKTLKKLKQIS